MPLTKLSLAHLPTPIHRLPALDALVGCEVWVKRDDMTAGAEAGNKIRKLEYLLSEALAQGATSVITCGGLQSNHARATVLLARRLGLIPHVLLRTLEAPRETPSGNWFLDTLAGANVRFITPTEYANRNPLMQQYSELLRDHGERAYVIPEGGSSGLGCLGYVDAIGEVRVQMDADPALPRRFDAVVHACGSGGTAAGVALGIARWNVADRAYAMAVCDDRSYFDAVIARLIAEAQALDPSVGSPGAIIVEDRFKGPAYGVADPEQLTMICDVARASGLALDPVYSGKAMYGLSKLEKKPQRTLFIHTGGLPGLLADAERFVAPGRT